MKNGDAHQHLILTVLRILLMIIPHTHLYISHIYIMHTYIWYNWMMITSDAKDLVFARHAPCCGAISMSAWTRSGAIGQTTRPANDMASQRCWTQVNTNKPYCRYQLSPDVVQATWPTWPTQNDKTTCHIIMHTHLCLWYINIYIERERKRK